MTFFRMMIQAVAIAAMTKVFMGPGKDIGSDFVGIVALTYIAWILSDDPLPDAIDKALDRYASKWRNR